MKITKREKQTIAQCFQDLPPWFMREEHCRTPDQKKYFEDCRFFFKVLGDEIDSYFRGDVSDLVENLSHESKEFCRQLRTRWVKYYGLIRDCWGEIVGHPEWQGIWSQILVTIPEPQSPGELFKLLLVLRSVQDLYPCLEVALPTQGKFSPSKSRKLWEKRRKLAAKKALGTLTAEELEKFYRENEKHNVPLPLEILHMYCLWRIDVAAKKSKFIAREWKEYQRNEAQLEADTMAFTHPQKKPVSYQWVNGERIYTRAP